MSPPEDPEPPAADALSAIVEAVGERSIAIAGDNYGTALTGDNARVVALPAEAFRPAAEVDAPPGLDNLPVRPQLFVGRALELDCLDAALAAPGQVVVQALHGLGGIGKSTLAAHWAATRAHGHAPVRWINAENAAGVQKGLADLATALQPTLAGAVPVEALAERALQWLATHAGWLLILDNVNDPADVAGLFARPATGRFLITSRLAVPWHHATTVIRLDILDEAESLELLTRSTTAAGLRDLDGAAELCAELGHLPLAIEQAAAYLVENPLTTPSPRVYLELLAQYPAAMYRDGAIGIPAERTIARVWHLTLERIAAAQPIAADLLRILAWYAPDRIPVALLAGFASPPELNRAIRLLTAYSMITPDPAAGTLAIHRLVQAVTRTPDPDGPHRAPADIAHARDQAAELLHASLPWDIFDAGNWSHFAALIAPYDSAQDTVIIADLLHRAAGYRVEEHRVRHAYAYVDRAAQAYGRLLGPDHPKTLACSSYDSRLFEDRTVRTYEKYVADALAEYKRSRASDRAGDFFVAMNRKALADKYRDIGDTARAVLAYEAAVAHLERLAGKNGETLSWRNSLADAYVAAGDLDRAIRLYEDTLNEYEQEAGPDHPFILATRRGLACAYRLAGDLGRAIALYETTFADSMRKFGPDYFGTRTVQSGLAYAYRTTGNLHQAIGLYKAILVWYEEKRGPDHHETQSARSNLAEVLSSVSRPENP
jgi:tetratricopeptide (TPR) repeat protein